MIYPELIRVVFILLKEGKFPIPLILPHAKRQITLGYTSGTIINNRLYDIITTYRIIFLPKLNFPP